MNMHYCMKQPHDAIGEKIYGAWAESTDTCIELLWAGYSQKRNLPVDHRHHGRQALETFGILPFYMI